jgi:hypothetical protein
VNPAGLMQVQPPSAVGPGAILHSNVANTSLAVGPGFGSNNNNNNNNNNNHRPNGQYGRGRQQAPQGNYDDVYNAFSYQLPTYTPQAEFNMPPWPHGQQLPQQMYGAFPMPAGGFPNASASGSPMNYGAYYPPTTYAASPAYGATSSGSAYRGGYPSTTAHAGAQSYTATATAGPSYGQYAPTFPTSGASYNTAYDPALMAAMQNMSFGK